MADNSAFSFESWAARWQETAARGGDGDEKAPPARPERQETASRAEAVSSAGSGTLGAPAPAQRSDRKTCAECGSPEILLSHLAVTGVPRCPGCARAATPKPVTFPEPAPLLASMLAVAQAEEERAADAEDDPEPVKDGTPENFERWLAWRQRHPEPVPGVTPTADGGIHISGAALLAARDEQPLDVDALMASVLTPPQGWTVETAADDSSTEQQIASLVRANDYLADRVTALVGDREIYLLQWQQEQAVTKAQEQTIRELRAEAARLTSDIAAINDRRDTAPGRRQLRTPVADDAYRLRGGAMFASGCAGCKIHIEKGEQAFYSKSLRKAWCIDCVSAPKGG